MKNSLERVLIITLNYNQNDFTLKCINSILESDFNDFKILLIDNGSTEENFLHLKNNLNKDSKVILKRLDPNRGYVGGINYGLEEGMKLEPDYFLIMNNDTIIDKCAIGELVKTVKEFNDKAIVSGKVYHYSDPQKLQMVGIKYNNKKLLITDQVGVDELDNGQYNKTTEYDSLDDIFWLFPAKLYSEIGGYSPYFWFNYEQEDYAIRAKNAGYKMIFTPNAKIWHKGSVSIGGREFNPNQAYWTVQSSLILKFIHLDKFQFVRYYLTTLISILRTFIKSFVFMIRGKQNLWKYAKAKFFGLIYFNKWLFLRNHNTGYNPLK